MQDRVVIHPSSVVDNSAVLEAGVEIGPFCYIGPETKIGANTRIISHVSILSHTIIGRDCLVYPNAVLGAFAQHRQLVEGSQGRVVIGNNCTIRECVTIHRATGTPERLTSIGNNCLLMSGSHVAHDCSIGDNVILVNGVALAGHVTVGHKTIISGLAGVAQRIHIGQCAFIAAGTLVNRDVLPFSLVIGTGARTKGVSVEGLKRLGWSSEKIRKLLYGMNLLFLGDKNGISALLNDDEIKDEMDIIVSFMKKSENGVCPADGFGIGLRVNKI